MRQREIWDSIAEDWNLKRQNPVPDTVKFLENKKGMVLDLGCGSGRNFARIDGTLIASDFSDKMLSFAKKRINRENLGILLVKSDAIELPFRDDSFDSIVMANVFHCIKWNYRNDVLKELNRVAKNGAQIFISVWNKDQPRFEGADKESFIGWKFKGKTYKRYYYLYSKDELESMLKKFFSGVKVFGSEETAEGKSKNLIATMKVKK